ncbi:nuclear transport factor 2 family protein [Shewanella sp. Isolate11]|uniref:nuclear transport factor 2 family protein n=1 Tax=Shewanella sp. Isolate11 TaxID=2908530 RepID=UPI001EFDFC61|nr:nuclear transport factor 2 family protein [Shewanella sp. Isolate11]MCG9697668.1 nuclear transport factor 2 family protein [Shewanella sp. Isolate11]
MTDNKRINALLDREEIRQLRIRYSQLLDQGQAEKMEQVFTEDAEVKVTVGSMKGLAAIKQGLKQAYHTFDTQNRAHFPFVHAITNHDISLIDENHASGSCYLLDFVTDRDPSQHPFLLLGHYVDQYVRVQGEWRISNSELDILWPQESH